MIVGVQESSRGIASAVPARLKATTTGALHLGACAAGDPVVSGTDFGSCAGQPATGDHRFLRPRAAGGLERGGGLRRGISPPQATRRTRSAISSAV